ncbi:Uncharacterised protein [Staphylococcus gallinarum]|uniref:Uncharacterized protein n=1 Tax=Staphylococcus gallinarum TaxID=1293 RepID=A0A380FBL1_STAGA|nr:Uncharacterised protein [Staphylococcus gallinarum]
MIIHVQNHQSYTGESVNVSISEATRNAIQQLAQDTGATDYMILFIIIYGAIA